MLAPRRTVLARPRLGVLEGTAVDPRSALIGPGTAVPVSDERLQRQAAALIRSRARSFYVASRFLPREVRREVQLVYAYYRTVDDLVDEPPQDWSRDDILAALSRWEEGIRGLSPVADPLCEAVVRIARRHNIPLSDLCMVIDGARFDMEMRAIETREELLRYSVQVAGSVGMVMARILGVREDRALDAACSLGVAMQLTNVLRDIGEDLDRGRMYLPREDRERCGCTDTMLQARRLTPELDAVVADLADEARSLYGKGADGIAMLHPSVRFGIQMAAELYSRILDKLAEPGFDPFRERAHLTTWEKWRVAAPAYLRRVTSA